MDKTNTLLYSFQEKDTVETTIRQHAYDLYMMIPQSIINQVTKHLVKEGKLEWDVATNTTGQEFYIFLQTFIRVAHKHQMILMSHNTDTTMMNLVEKVFITKDVGAHTNG